jgi:hypothetical protein
MRGGLIYKPSTKSASNTSANWSSWSSPLVFISTSVNSAFLRMSIKELPQVGVISKRVKPLVTSYRYVIYC